MIPRAYLRSLLQHLGFLYFGCSVLSYFWLHLSGCSQSLSSSNWTLVRLSICHSGLQHYGTPWALRNSVLPFFSVPKVTTHDKENVTKLFPSVFLRLLKTSHQKVMKRSCTWPWRKREWCQEMHHPVCWERTGMAHGSMAVKLQAEHMNLLQVGCDFPLHHLPFFPP